MILPALVIDNSKFFKRGTITVRIADFYFAEMNWDLSSDYPNSIDAGKNSDDPDFSYDFEAMLFAPLGGGRNYGALFLPQINEKGLVMFLRGNQKYPIWMGSYFEPTFDEQYSITHVNVPSDNPDNEGEDSDGSISESQNMDADSDEDALGKNVVIRTKTTQYGSADDVNFQKTSTSNIISIGNKQFRIRHYDDDGWNNTTAKKWQEIIIEKDSDNSDKETLKATVVNDTDSKIGKIDITEDTIKISVDINGTESYIELNSNNEITIKADGQKVIFDSAISEINFMGNADNLVTYNDLEEIINGVLDHIHIAPTGPTGPPMDSTMAPLKPQLISAKMNMKADDLKLE